MKGHLVDFMLRYQNMSFLSKLFGDENQKYLDKISPNISLINAFEPELKTLSDDDLKAKTSQFKARLSDGETLDEILPEAFAVVREAAMRTLGLRHFDVQLLGGMILHQGRIAEMKTGEGKTLVATLPTYLNALTGKGVHLVTVNDYLARRDAVWMGQIYSFLGLSVGVLNNQISYLYDPNHTDKDRERDDTGSFHVVYEFLKNCSRKEAYAADITYGTNNEYGFDYLRDHIAYTPEGVVQRADNRNFVIIDEVDSILIDESRTPLIISSPVSQSGSLYGTFAKISEVMEKDVDFTVDEKLKAISLTDEGITKAEKLLGVGDIYTEKGVKYVHHLETAVRARALYILDKDYVVKNGEIIIVDEFTGRLQPGRRWSEGLHQAIEAKEGVEVKEETRTFATITLQNYFRLYDKLSGMTGTAMTSQEEFLKVYGLDTVSIPTNQPNQRVDLPDQIFQSEKGKIMATCREVKERHTKGQPVLIGTVSIEKNELLSLHFKKEGIPHKVLNAKNHEEEGQIIADAGKLGSVVIATNMAGRGVDIKLGGAMATPEEHEEVKSLGGLYVLGTERHEARRIDNQLRGRAGRQGDPGATQFFLSMEDTLMRVFASAGLQKMMSRFGIPEDEPIENRMVSKSVESAQSKIEGFNFDARKHLLEYDDVMTSQRLSIYDKRSRILFGGQPEVEEFWSKAFEALDLPAEEVEEVKAKIDKKKLELGEDNFVDISRKIILQVMDMLWVEHLEAIDYMRSSVRLRAYGQRDPLVEFKREGLKLFKDMEFAIIDNVIRTMQTVESGIKDEEATHLEEVHEGAMAITNARGNTSTPTNEAGETIGRNDPCPCGAINPATGHVYKYKQCGLINAPQHKK